MSKYIDADRLKAEIERRIGSWSIRGKNSPAGQGKDTCESRATELSDLLSFITSLQQEQPEVELGKELDQWRHKHFKGKRDGNYNGEYLERESQLDLAHHFYELGLKARKED